MQTRTGRCALLALALYGSGDALAQSTAKSTEDRLNRAEQRLDELEKRHQAELKQRDQKIAELESKLHATPTTVPATGPDHAHGDDIDHTRAAIHEDAHSHGLVNEIQQLGHDFKPSITVITDFVGSVTPRNDRGNDAYNRFDVREAELDLRAAVGPRADGVAVFAFERDVHNPIFPELGEDGEDESVESSANIEEAYLFLHDFGIPNLTAKVGRFHVSFGRQNLLHLHELPTTDAPFVNQAFLAPEALVDAGASFSYVVPPKYTGGQHIEAVAEILSGEGADSESPTLNGGLEVDSPALNFHLMWNRDIRRDLNLELGASWLTAHRAADNAQDLNLFGVDVTLLRTDRAGGFSNTMFQAELMYGDVDDDAGTNHALGAYVVAQQQLNRDLYAGLRLDWTENPNDDEQEAWGVTPYVSWYWSEFLRWRFSYQHRESEVDAEDIFYVQGTWILGAHPPHGH